jgi:hypothetical protein
VGGLLFERLAGAGQLRQGCQEHGLHQLARACQALEEEPPHPYPDMAQMAPLWEAWMQTQSHLRRWLPVPGQAPCPLSNSQLQQFLELLQRRAPHEQLLEASRRWEAAEPTRVRRRPAAPSREGAG